LSIHCPFYSENRQRRQAQKLVGVRVSGGDLCEAEAPTEATAETPPLGRNLAYARLKIQMKKYFFKKESWKIGA
jgi:hypothetical protein